ncbi:MAG: hypothetical protein AAF404_13185 [Pseudomonadota bacterium]
MQQWLSDNDTDSLPALATLADADNTAAKLLLSRIETTDRAPGHYLLSLERSQWHELFRQSPTDESVFAPSWLRVESERGNPLANHLLNATTPAIDLKQIQSLITAGEVEAAEHLIRKIAVDGSDQQRDELLQRLNDSHELYPYLQGFRYASQGTTTGHYALQRMAADTQTTVVQSTDDNYRHASTFVDIGYQAGDRQPEFNLTSQYRKIITDWVITAAVAKPLATLCNRSCTASEMRDCQFTAFGLMGGYYEIIRLDSPLENIITQQQFLSSERAVGMVWRSVTYARTETTGYVFSGNALSGKSACLGRVAARLDTDN